MRYAFLLIAQERGSCFQEFGPLVAENSAVTAIRDDPTGVRNCLCHLDGYLDRVQMIVVALDD